VRHAVRVRQAGAVRAVVLTVSSGAPAVLLTVGHGTSSEEELGGRLRDAGVRALVDIRIGPGSRRNPHLAKAALEQWLPPYGVDYRWERRLGGFRTLPPDSPDTALRNDSFRAYATHMRTAEFAAAIDGVLDEARRRLTAVMCSETVWWRCHRRLVADFVRLARDVEVRHLMPGGRLAPHVPTDGVRLRPDGLLAYDGGRIALDDLS
jgi:uncharacterized protein (DUF488 family)